MDNVIVTQADIHAAALQWCGEKDRETSLDDIHYFQANWDSLPGLCSRVEAFARHRTEATRQAEADKAELVERIQKASRWRYAEWAEGIIYEVPEALFEELVAKHGGNHD